MIFDDKSQEAVNLDGRLILNSPIDADEVAFRATYYITTDIVCGGKITALFDIFVLGDVTAHEIDVKGKFVCLGKCEVDGIVVVQNDIIVSALQANTIICHENITAQEVDAVNITCNGKMIIERTLAVESLAKCDQTIICGETAYGSGRIVANTVITGEPIDLDEGEEALESPYTYEQEGEQIETNDIISVLSKKYCADNDYRGYLMSIVSDGNDNQKIAAESYLSAFASADKMLSEGIDQLRDTKLLLQFLDIANSGWFDGWQIVDENTKLLLSHFEVLASGNNPYLPKAKPATDLEIGDHIRHTTYGNGIVTKKGLSSSGSLVEISFQENGIKRFTLPAAIKFFEIIGSQTGLSPDEIRSSLVCNVGSYREWLECLRVLYDNAERISPSLNSCIYDLLMSNLGLKSKFVYERLQEKGWKVYGK